MLQPYVPLLVLIAFVVANAVLILALSHVLSSYRRTPVKSAPYESGIPVLGDARERFSIKFYLVAMLFIIFDIEPGHDPGRWPSAAYRISGAPIVRCSSLGRAGAARVYGNAGPGNGTEDADPSPDPTRRSCGVPRIASHEVAGSPTGAREFPLAMRSAPRVRQRHQACRPARFDLARLRMERMSFSRPGDLLICAGRLRSNCPIIRASGDQSRSPKWSISRGACAYHGGHLENMPWCRASTHIGRRTFRMPPPAGGADYASRCPENDSGKSHCRPDARVEPMRESGVFLPPRKSTRSRSPL